MIHTATQSSKFVKLVRKLRPLMQPGLVKTETIAVGILEKLWHTTMVNTPRGDIGRLDDESIAESIGFDGDEGILISILVECGWLDRSDEHRLIVHDWHEHAPRHIKQNIARKGGFVTEHASRETKNQENSFTRDVKQPLNVSPETVSTEISRAPNQTKPNQTKELSVEPSASTGRTASSEVEFVIEHYRKHHPQAKPGKKERAAITARLRDGYTPAELAQAIDGMHKTPHNLGQNDRNQKFLSLELCMRSSDQVTRFIENNGTPRASPSRRPPDVKQAERIRPPKIA